ncbi:hypothetical protein D7X74_40285 [Corallococcus sp. CA047B]|nr:hypothetical protein D7X74_40285 [Corallococcus sp. CA047B]
MHHRIPTRWTFTQALPPRVLNVNGCDVRAWPGERPSPSLNVALGNRPGGGTPFKGRIDAVRVYGRVLSAAELQQL